MGWSFGWNTRRQLVEYLTKGESSPDRTLTVLAHCLRGNVLWSVVEMRRDDGAVRVIRCDLLTRSGLDWGYKGMDETCGPCYYTCPLSYLDMVPDGPFVNESWRGSVRAYHAKRTEARERAKRLRQGDVFSLTEGHSLKGDFLFVAHSGSAVLADYAPTGQRYRVKPHQIGKVWAGYAS